MSALLIAAPAVAGDPAPFPEFTFKRVKVPKPGDTPQITVQIDPSQVARVITRPATDAPADAPPEEGQPDGSPFAWYWNVVSPTISDTGPERLQRALLQLGRGPAGTIVASPRLGDMQAVAEKYGADILRATVGTRVSPALALAVIGVESAGRPAVVSKAGAIGLMQLIPATAERFGVSDPRNPGQNIRGGVAYLDWLLSEFHNDPVLALAAYNAGENSVRRHEGVPPYDETRAYVPKVLAAWGVARALCQTPPELVGDACVFATREARNEQ